MKISAVIIAFNEENNIARALESVSWVDDILVVDSGSSDKTIKIAESLGARTIFNEWQGFSKQKQFAVDNAKHDIVLSLDADEVVSPELKHEIIALKDSQTIGHGYFISRLAFYHGRPIRHSGWYPDKQLRLFDRTKGRWNDRTIHESFKLDGGLQPSELRSDILHYSVDNAAHHHKMIGERYAPLAAQHMYENGRKASLLNIITAGPAAFIRSYVLKAGFLDGFAGYCIAKFAAHHAFLKYLMLWELHNSEEK